MSVPANSTFKCKKKKKKLEVLKSVSLLSLFAPSTQAIHQITESQSRHPFIFPAFYCISFPGGNKPSFHTNERLPGSSNG